MSDVTVTIRCIYCINGPVDDCLCTRVCHYQHSNEGHCTNLKQHYNTCYTRKVHNGTEYKILHCTTCGCNIYHPTKCPGSEGKRCSEIRDKTWGDRRRCPKCHKHQPK